MRKTECHRKTEHTYLQRVAFEWARGIVNVWNVRFVIQAARALNGQLARLATWVGRSRAQYARANLPIFTVKSGIAKSEPRAGQLNIEHRVRTTECRAERSPLRQE